MDVKAPGTEVVAVRVDAVEQTWPNRMCCSSGERRLALAPLSADATVPAQATVGISRGFIWNMIALIHQHHTHRTVMVRLYRPGYQMVEIRPSLLTGEVVWKDAGSFLQRERAIDQVVYLSWSDNLDSRAPTWTEFTEVAPGSASPEHRRALEFLAGEYEKLSLDPAAALDDRARLTQKATNLRKLAEK